MGKDRETSDERPPAEDGQARVQCPNCCRMAPVVRRDMGLLFFRCELCLSVGAVPEDAD